MAEQAEGMKLTSFLLTTGLIEPGWIRKQRIWPWRWVATVPTSQG